MTEKQVLEKLEQFKIQIKALKEKYKKQLEEVEDKISSLENENKRLNNQISSLNEKNDILLEQKESYEKQISSFEKLETENKSLKEQLVGYAELRKKCTSLENTLKEKGGYSENDIKKAIKETSAKFKEKVETLTKQNLNWEENYKVLSDKYAGLETTNKSLERKLAEYATKEDIDKVLKGQLTSKEIDEIAKKGVIKPAEKELEEMLNGG